MGAFSRKEAVPGSLGGGTRRPVVYLSTVLYREAVTLRSPGSLAQQRTLGSLSIFAGYAEGVSQRDTVGAADLKQTL